MRHASHAISAAHRDLAERRRMNLHAEALAAEKAAQDEAKRKLGELFIEVQEREDHLRALESEAPTTNGRPDERELFADRAEDEDWNRAHEDYERGIH